MKRSSNAKRKMSLTELDHHLKKRASAATRRAAAPRQPIGVESEIDRLKGSRRSRGIVALLELDSSSPKSALGTVSRAYDVGAPIQTQNRRSRAYGFVYGETNAIPWPSIVGEDQADPATRTIAAFTVEAFDAAPYDTVATLVPEEVPAPAPDVARDALRESPPRDPPNAPTEVALPRAEALDSDAEFGSAFAADNDEESAAFARQIQALLNGTKRAPEQAPPPAPSAAQAQWRAAARPHDIFEQMGRNMAYATAFHLPPMELGKRFDAIERQIAREEALSAPEPERDFSFGLTDEEIREGLRLASEPQPAAQPAPPSPAQPAPPAVEVATNGSPPP